MDTVAMDAVDVAVDVVMVVATTGGVLPCWTATTVVSEAMLYAITDIQVAVYMVMPPTTSQISLEMAVRS